MKDQLGQRMKEQYEHRTRFFLPRRTFTIIRLDGKAFHTYTRGMKRPFDQDMVNAMHYTCKGLMKEIGSVNLVYTQSDEISIVLTDFNKITTEAWFNGNIQKIASVSASIATAYFNRYMWQIGYEMSKMAFFDSRAYSIPDRTEVKNYIIWRQKDAQRNSVSMLAQSLFSHKDLQNKSQVDMLEMVKEKGHDWEKLYPSLRNGTFFSNDKKEGEKGYIRESYQDCIKDKEFLESVIPNYEI